jgi:hypothetical protein
MCLWKKYVKLLPREKRTLSAKVRKDLVSWHAEEEEERGEGHLICSSRSTRPIIIIYHARDNSVRQMGADIDWN